MDYAVIYEKRDTGHAAYVLDLPGCVATGATRTQVERRIRSAIRMHLDAMRQDHEPLPVATTWTKTVRSE